MKLALNNPFSVSGRDPLLESPTREKVLIADDQNIIRKIVSKILGDTGYDVIEAQSPEEAVLQVESENPGLVFLDIYFQSDEPEGIDVLRKIRGLGYTNMVCMLTGSQSPELLYDALLFGANDYIVKGHSFLDAQHSCFDTLSCIHQVAKQSKTQPEYRTFDPIVDGVFFKSKGLCDSQLELLSAYAKAGFPDLCDLSTLTGISENTLVKRFSRIGAKLGMDNRVQLAKVLTIVSGYGARYRR